MTNDRHARVAALFSAAAEMTTEARSAFLAEHARDEAEMAEVERLLASDSKAGGFLSSGSVPDHALVDALADMGPHTGNELAAIPERIGSYRPVERLGAGASGIVLLAEQDGTEQRVALKLLRHSWTGPKAVARFRQEAKILGRLAHTGIARILDAGTADLGAGEQAYLALEYVAGATLVEHARRRELDVEQRVRLLVDVCTALHHAHERGVIHRDVKPDNVLVTEEGSVKVLDFGVARVADPDLRMTTLQTDQVQILGTVGYMSPEQAAGDWHRIDRRTDVYSIGAVAYELLSGCHALELGDCTILEALRRVQEEDPRPLTVVGPRVPGDLGIVVHKALAKEPERRYSSAAELAEDLGRWLRHEPIRARRVGSLYALRQFARRHRALTGSLTAIFVVLVVAVLVSLVLLGRATRATEQARWQSYVAAISAAASEVRGGAPEQAWALLQEAPEEHRNLEWRLLRNLAEPSLRALHGHAYNIWDVAISPDGRFAYSCAGDATVRVWDLELGREHRVLRDHGDRVYSVDASLDGAWVASGSADETVRIRDARTYEPAAVLEGHGTLVSSLAFSNDSSFLASGAADGSLLLWERPDWHSRRSLSGHADRVWSVAFAPDDRLLASVSEDGTLALWDVETGECLASRDVESEAVVSVSFDPLGERLAIATFGGEVQLWNVDGLQQLAREQLSDGELGCVAFSPDGSLLVAGTRFGGVVVLDAADPSRMLRRAAHVDWVRSVAFSPDGERLVSGSWDDIVRIWDVRRLRARMAPFTRESGPFEFNKIPGTWFASALEDSVELREVATDRVLRKIADPLDHGWLRLDPTGRFLAFSATNEAPTIRVLEVSSGSTVLEVPGGAAVAWSPDGALLATSTLTGHGPIAVWAVEQGELRASFEGGEGYVCTIAFHPEGRRLLANGPPDCNVSVWNLETGKLDRSLAGHRDMVLSIRFDETGRFLVTTSSDRTAIVRDAKTLEPLATLVGHSAHVMSADFDPSGERIVTVTEAGDLRIWKLGQPGPLAVLRGVEGARHVRFSPEGDFLAVYGYPSGTMVFDAR